LTEVDKKFELKLSKSQISLYCKIKSKEKGIIDYYPKK